MYGFFIRQVKEFIRISLYFYQVIEVIPATIKAILTDRKYKKKGYLQILIQELFHTGVGAIPMVLILGFTVGFILIQLFPFDKISFGIKNIYGYVYATFIIREMAPLFTMLIVLVRSTAYITIRLTQMKIDGEIEVLEIMGINPLQYSGALNIIAGIINIPILTIYFILAAFISGVFSAYFFHNVSPVNFSLEIFNSIHAYDFLIYFIRTISCGVLIFFIAIYNGLSAPGDISMIWSRTVRAITTSVIMVILFNFLITVFFYGGR